MLKLMPHVQQRAVRKEDDAHPKPAVQMRTPRQHQSPLLTGVHGVKAAAAGGLQGTSQPLQAAAAVSALQQKRRGPKQALGAAKKLADFDVSKMPKPDSGHESYKVFSESFVLARTAANQRLDAMNATDGGSSLPVLKASHAARKQWIETSVIPAITAGENAALRHDIELALARGLRLRAKRSIETTAFYLEDMGLAKVRQDGRFALDHDRMARLGRRVGRRTKGAATSKVNELSQDGDIRGELLLLHGTLKNYTADLSAYKVHLIQEKIAPLEGKKADLDKSLSLINTLIDHTVKVAAGFLAGGPVGALLGAAYSGKAVVDRAVELIKFGIAQFIDFEKRRIEAKIKTHKSNAKAQEQQKMLERIGGKRDQILGHVRKLAKATTSVDHDSADLQSQLRRAGASQKDAIAIARIFETKACIGQAVLAYKTARASADEIGAALVRLSDGSKNGDLKLVKTLNPVIGVANATFKELFNKAYNPGSTIEASGNPVFFKPEPPSTWSEYRDLTQSGAEIAVMATKLQKLLARR